MSEEKKLTVVVPPEVLADLEQSMSNEEIQEMLDELQRLAETGELFEQSQPVDLEKLKEEDPELYRILSERMDQYEDIEDMFDRTINNRTLN